MESEFGRLWNEGILWNEQEEFMKSTEQVLKHDESCDKLVQEILKQVEKIKSKGFKPEFVLMNVRNYERLIAWGDGHKNIHTYPPESIFGLTVMVWDVPIDYVNVRCKASVEWSYGEGLRK